MIVNKSVTLQSDSEATPIEVDDSIIQFIRALCDSDKKIMAIKLLRYVYEQKHGAPLGLKYAKDACDYIDSNRNFSVGFSSYT